MFTPELGNIIILSTFLSSGLKPPLRYDGNNPALADMMSLSLFH